MARLHVVDSLSGLHLVADAAARGPVVDLGSGGGFPGLPLAAALPGAEVLLVDSIAKKTRFLEVAVAAAGLADRVHVVRARAEELGRDPGYREAAAVVTARAVAPLAELLQLALPLAAPGGRLVAWKRGPDLAREIAEARPALAALGGGTIDDHPVVVPGLEGHRLVVVTKRGRRSPALAQAAAGARRRRRSGP